MNFKAHLGFRILKFLLILVIGGSLITSYAYGKPRDKGRWDSKYDKETYIFGRTPVAFLKDNVHLLPKGKVLDLAMGEGRNGVFLATQGFDVEGWDISEVGLQKAHKLAEEHGVQIKTRVVDLEAVQFEKNSYDVVLIMYYMQRDLFHKIMAALKPGGMAMIETYNTDYLKYASFNRKYLLEPNELLEHFKDYKIIRYQAFDDGKEAYSSIIVQNQPAAGGNPEKSGAKGPHSHGAQ
jgi:tRNA G46 methylase TrmB